jgi:hypothetical protein
MTKKRLLFYNVVSAVTLTLAAVLVILATFWMVYPYKTTEMHKATIINPVVKQGQVLVIKYDYTKYIEKSAMVYRTFVDSLVYGIPPVQSNVPMGHNVILRDILIPMALPPGVYKISTKLEFQANPIRKVYTEYETPTFTVIPANPHPDEAQDETKTP